MSGVFISVRQVVIVPPVIIQYWRGDPPETGCSRNYDPLWKNDLSGNWIINDSRWWDEELAEDVGLEKSSEKEEG